MLSKKELTGYSEALGLTLGQTELDYIHHHMLSILGQTTRDKWVFKGGTCLQKVLGLDRFSEDLDFTTIGEPDIDEHLSKVVDRLSLLGLRSHIKSPNTSKGRDGGVIRVLVEGPLFDGRERTRCSVRFNLSQREDLLRGPVAVRAMPPYPDVLSYLIYRMEQREMLAEKVRALLKRDKARDLYDVAFLLQKGTTLDGDMVRKKLAIYPLELTHDLVKKQVTRKGPLWEKELAPLVHGPLPPFKKTARRVLTALNALVDEEM